MCQDGKMEGLHHVVIESINQTSTNLLLPFETVVASLYNIVLLKSLLHKLE